MNTGKPMRASSPPPLFIDTDTNICDVLSDALAQGNVNEEEKETSHVPSPDQSQLSLKNGPAMELEQAAHLSRSHSHQSQSDDLGIDDVMDDAGSSRSAPLSLAVPSDSITTVDPPTKEKEWSGECVQSRVVAPQSSGNMSGNGIPDAVPSDRSASSLSSHPPKILEILKSVTKIGRMNLASGCKIPCKISSVESPSLFWVQVEATCIAEDMSREFSEMLLMESLEVQPETEVGLFCVCRGPDERLRRAVIVDVLEAQGRALVNVFYIDFGTRSFVAANSLFQLPQNYFHHPWQATGCCLAEVFPGPAGGSDRWSEDAVHLFRETVLEKTLVVESLDTSGQELPYNNFFLVSLLEKSTLVGEQKEVETFYKSVATSLKIRSKGHIGFAKQRKDLLFFRCPESESVVVPDTLAPWQEGLGPENDAGVSLARRPAPGTSMTRSVDRSYDGPIFVGAEPTDPKLYRGPQVLDLDMEEWLAPDGSMEFLVAELTDPSEFYVHPVKAGGDGVRGRELMTLSKNLNEFYSTVTNQRLIDVPTLRALDAGERMYGMVDKGAAPGSEEFGVWQRVELCGVRFSNSGGVNARLRHGLQGAGRHGTVADEGRLNVKVRYLDWGGSEWKMAQDICAIDKRFCSVPPLAWACSLYGVKGTESEGTWSQESLEFFRRMMRTDIPLKGYVIDHDKESGSGPIIRMLVMPDNNEDDGYLRTRMLRNNLAEEIHP